MSQLSPPRLFDLAGLICSFRLPHFPSVQDAMQGRPPGELYRDVLDVGACYVEVGMLFGRLCHRDVAALAEMLEPGQPVDPHAVMLKENAAQLLPHFKDSILGGVDSLSRALLGMDRGFRAGAKWEKQLNQIHSFENVTDTHHIFFNSGAAFGSHLPELAERLCRSERSPAHSEMWQVHSLISFEDQLGMVRSLMADHASSYFPQLLDRLALRPYLGATNT